MSFGSRPGDVTTIEAYRRRGESEEWIAARLDGKATRIREPGPRVSFQYVHLDSRSEYQPGRFVIQFAGTKLWRVTVTGRNLWKLYDGITRHAIAWIQQAMPGRDFEEKKGHAVITQIEVEEVGEKR